jgi:hypothetical protein
VHWHASFLLLLTCDTTAAGAPLPVATEAKPHIAVAEGSPHCMVCYAPDCRDE